MKGIIKVDFRANRIRSDVLHLIRHQLYPVTEFPKNLFPDLPTVLFDCFLEAVRSQEDLLVIYRESKEVDEIKNLAQKILTFKNLLENYPQTVVLMYRTYIKKFIKYRHPNTDEWEDIFQEVITRLISGKIYRIREKFNFSYYEETPGGKKKSFFTSYLIVTVRNIYMDIIRERRVRPLTASGLQPMDETVDVYENKQMLSKLIINEEFQRLRTILTLYYKSRPRLELCLKLKCRISLTGNDIRQCFPDCSPEEFHALSQDFTGLRDKKMFDIVTPVFNRNECTENKSDTLRKWVSIKVDEITAHLNQSHGCEVYNSKNFVDFVSLYYEEDNMSKVGEIGNSDLSPRR
jgi:DNA-directed RNA polymerase specialized sigma24 family protein